MTHWVNPVVVFLVFCSSPVKSDIKDVEYGLAQAKRVAAGVCWVETINKLYQNNSGDYSVRECRSAHNYIRDLERFRQRNSRNWAGPGPEPEQTETTYIGCILNVVEFGMRNYLSGFKACQLYLEDINAAPNKDYGWFLGGNERSEYPYKAYAHCLLEAMEFYYGKKSLDDLNSHWDNPKRQVSFEEYDLPYFEGVEENSENWKEFKLPGMDGIDSPFSDLENGIIQAEKVIKGVCVAEMFNNPLYECSIYEAVHTKFVKYRWLFRNHETNEETIAEDKATLVSRMRPLFEYTTRRNLPGYSVCDEYSKDANKIAPKDYGWLFGDGKSPDDPYRGYANCLLEILENRNGEKALEDLKSNWESPRTLQEIMLEVENRRRALHGVPPMELDEELSIRAQRWVDVLANEKCDLVHMKKEKPDHPDMIYQDRQCGESIGASRNSNADDNEIGVLVATLFYKEIELYPWPAFDGEATDELFKKIGHFTQSVWKETSHAGYAIGRGKCNMVFVVARYWPAGNTMHVFEENVLPLIS